MILFTEKQKAGQKKISIKNLKNSTVYEATIKEIEERERLKAEKYEEGEITSSSSSTDSDSAHEEVANNGIYPYLIISSQHSACCIIIDSRFRFRLQFSQGKGESFSQT